MEKVLDGQLVQRTTTVDAEQKVVHKHHVTTHKVHGCFELDTSFDFSKCTENQILELASRDALIKFQNTFRSAKKVDGLDKKVIDMSITASRVKLTDMQHATKRVDILSKEEKETMVAYLQEGLKVVKED